jgi:hypothetical protein
VTVARWISVVVMAVLLGLTVLLIIDVQRRKR